MRPLRFDSFVLRLNLLLEFDGQQHFQDVDHWGGDASFEETVRRDSLKNKRVKRNGYRLVRIPCTTENIANLLRTELF